MALQRSILIIFFTCLGAVSYAQDTTGVAYQQRNIISVVQFQFTENGLGFGASYERVLDKKGLLAFYVPAMVTFNIANSNRIYDYNTGNYSTGKANAMYYAMPGLKFYPTGCYGRVKYAVGLSLVVGSGKTSVGYVNYYGLNIAERIVPHFVAGGMAQNSLNVNVGKRVYAGVELGIGTSFTNRVDNKEQGSEFLIQGSVKIGCRF